LICFVVKHNIKMKYILAFDIRVGALFKLHPSSLQQLVHIQSLPAWSHGKESACSFICNWQEEFFVHVFIIESVSLASAIHTKYNILVCIHIYQAYLTELHVLLNPLLPLSRISDNSKFCTGPVSFERTRFNCNWFVQYSKSLCVIVG
jgi:hypothetical protein